MRNHHRNILLLLGLGVLFFLPFLGSVHLFDWDEINFAEISREMILTGDFLSPQINFLPFYEKPPLFNWLQVFSMTIFGVGEYAARLPNALGGILTLVLIYSIGSHIHNKRFGLFWAFAFMGSVLPFFYFKSGIIDPIFNLFIFVGIWGYILSLWNESKHHLLGGGLIMGLAVLTKGPVAILIFLLTALIFSVIKKRFNGANLALFIFIALIPPSIWLLIESIQSGSAFFHQFMDYHLSLLTSPVAGHRGFPGFHVVVLIIGCFPASIFAIRSLFNRVEKDTDFQKDFMLWMKILFWVVLILFSIVQSKIIHYSSLCYFPLTYLAARTIQQISDGEIRFSKALMLGLWSLGGLYALTCFSIPLLGMNTGWIVPFINDSFAVENLGADVSWRWFHFLPGLILLLVLILSSWFIFNRRRDISFSFLFIGIAVFSFLTITLFTPNIERYTQHAAIEFYKERINEDCYIDTWGFKSYAHLFYSNKRIPIDARHSDINWLLEGDINHRVYMVVRSLNAEDFKRKHPAFSELDRKNGFVFFQRNPLPINDAN